MFPLFHIFNRTISIYTLMSLIGVLVCLLAAYRLAKNNGLDEIEMLYVSLFSFGAVAIGGALMYGITQFESLVLLLKNIFTLNFASFDDFLDQAKFVFGGSVFYGGLIGAVLTIIFYCRKKKLSNRYLDVAAICFPLFHFFGRIGCFLGGCCYGIESEFGVVYHHSPAPGANGVSRFPVQLFEAVFNLGLCILFHALFRKKKLHGSLIHVYFYAYPVFRFADEFLRGDAYRGILWGLSTSQWISIALVVINTIILLRKAVKNGSNEPEQEESPKTLDREPAQMV